MDACDVDKTKSLTREWMSWDENSKTKAEVGRLEAAEDWDSLAKIMTKRLAFGTAGIRGRMGPGFSQMNDLVIIQVTQGLMHYMKKVHNIQDLMKKGVVFGFDGRHNSARWAKLAAGVFLRENIPVYLFKTTTPTPFIPFTIVKLGAAAGVMVTASHNPKWDNGYKVYWDNGAQILSPHDKEIQNEILNNLKPVPGAFQEPEENNPLLSDPMADVYDSYFNIIKESVGAVTGSLAIPIVYTAMHGVGNPYVIQAWKSAGFKESTLHPVEEQAQPDPEFSTVDFPNPEEGPSALNLSFKKADLIGAKYILANDPDADRLGVAEKVNGTWKILSGNDLGALLGWWCLKTFKDRNPGFDMSSVNLMASTVSSKFLQTMCTKEGAVFRETLTGFKHMGNLSHTLINQGGTVLFAFEEAIGFMCGCAVLDKDGVSAAARMGELIAQLEVEGSSLVQQVNKLYGMYGYHCTYNSYYLCYDPATTDAIFNRIRSFQGKEDTYPSHCGGVAVTRVRDLTTGFDSATPDKVATMPASRSSQMVTFWLENGIVLTLRTSGTEPKIKFYTEFCGQPGLNQSEWGGLEAELKRVVNTTLEDLMQPAINGLKPKP